MVSKATKIRLGIFIAIGSLLILVFAGAVAGSRLVQKRDIYFIEFQNYSVSGLQVGGPVNYQGIKVGRVEEIKINPKDVTRIVLKISVEAGTPIKADAEAVLALIGITGLKAVEIKGGTNESILLKPKSYIKAGVTMLDDISDRAMSIAEKLDMIAANISDLTSDENRKNIAKILEQTSLLIADTRTNMSSTLASLSMIAKNTANITTDLGRNMDNITNNLTKNMDLISNSTATGIDSVATASKTSIETLTKTLNSELLMITNKLEQSITQITNESSALISDARVQVKTVGEHSDLMVLETTKQIATISANLNRSLDQLNILLDSPEFTKLMVNLTALSGQLAEANLTGMVTELGTTMHRAGILVTNLNRIVVRGQSNMLDMIDNLAEASENLNEFSRQISDTPSILLRGN